ncbi:MAG: UvrD-helicase domain-containing protein [Clostridia bacterium]|nr:UvrD-helicase domain-containing protein [Clostridia bacterium]
MDKQELNYFHSVQAFIDAQMQYLSQLKTEQLAQARAEGAQFSLDNPYGAVYGHAFDLQESIGKKMQTVNDCIATRYILEKMRVSPYFGRVDFQENGYAAEQIYVGLRTLMDSDSLFVHVYDWRTPVCSLFYTGETGKASYTAPMGLIDGEIQKIRQYQFKDGELVACWDADLRIDDTVLRNVLSGASSDRLKVIVCSIQREQNRCIRFDTKKSLAVFGPAGCGKTSIGMHRLAWLLYELRTSLISKDILLFTNNVAFLHYVSGVLPDLGEEEVRSCLFSSLLEQYLPEYTVTDYYELAEAVLEGNEHRTRTVNAVYDPDFLAYVDRCLDLMHCRFFDIRVFGDVALSAETMKKKYEAFSVNLSVHARLQLLLEWARDEIEDYFIINRLDLTTKLLEKHESHEPLQKLMENLKNSALGNLEMMINGAVAQDTVPLYYRFFRAWCKEKDLVDNLAHRMGNRLLNFEDAVMALYIAAKLGNCEQDEPPAHILLDEAQDYSVLQHKILRLLYPKAVFTLLADTNQALVPQLNTTSEAQLCEIYGASVMKLGKSYRATKQLSEFSKQFLDGADYDVFDREGQAPFVYHTKKEAKQAAEIAKNVPADYNSVCILADTAATAAKFHKEIKKYLPDCELVNTAYSRMSSKVIVMPVTLSKGLEFDAVIIPHAEDLEKNRRVAYMMTTRALHELHLLYKEEN